MRKLLSDDVHSGLKDLPTRVIRDGDIDNEKGYSVITFVDRYTNNKGMEEDPETCILGIAKDTVKGEMFHKRPQRVR